MSRSSFNSAREFHKQLASLRGLLLAFVVGSMLWPPNATAQDHSRIADPARPGFWWIGGALVVAAAASDAALERASLAHRSVTLDHLERTGNALGTGRNIIPVLGATYVAGWLGHRKRVTDIVLHTAVGYAAGDFVASIGKPLFGRHRPDTTGSPWRFHPFARRGEWHSLPSAHALHAFTIAGAVSEEMRQPWVTATTYGAASIVAWSRIYRDEHWASDVTASAVAGTALGITSVRFFHARQRKNVPPFQVTPWHHGIAVSIGW
jgi:membrane-associated phospholipid phosphatase